jgi:hypothetical protein
MEENTNIDNTTMYVYDRIINTGDTSILGGNHVERWESINKEIVDRYGANENYLAYLEKMAQYVVYLDIAINGGDRSAINFAKKYKNEAQDLLNRMNTDTGIDKYYILTKHMGVHISPKVITIAEFYGYLKSIQNGKEV